MGVIIFSLWQRRFLKQTVINTLKTDLTSFSGYLVASIIREGKLKKNTFQIITNVSSGF